jgi:hypothetical protein
VGFNGEFRLFEDSTQSDDTKAKVTKWAPKSPIFGSYALTLTFQSCPSQSPSSFPSSFPFQTDTPSSMPSSSPSQSPSGIPSSSPSSSSLPSSYPSNSPSRNPSSVPSNFPSNDPSINPSPLPSNVPSEVPSDTPSSKPSETPSEKPSIAPSNDLSSFPSVSPTSTCPISEFTGRTFVIALSIDGCFKLEIFDGGHIYADFNNKDCSNPQFDASEELSDYDGTADGNKATFVTNGKADKWSGVLFVVQGDADSTEISSLDLGQRRFELLLKTTKCVVAPSMSPSIPPTSVPSNSNIPSKFPTRQPSSIPSSIPSLTPSVLPTNIPSSLPSLYPSVSPSSTCPFDGFLGRTFKSVVYNACWIFDFSPTGKFKIDPTDSTCSRTTPDKTAYDLSQYKEGVSNRILFQQIPDQTSWKGYIQIIEDTELTEESLTRTKVDWNNDEFVFMLKVPDCPSSAPSISKEPSSEPSSKPSSKPSVNSSSEPSQYPSDFPSKHPSEKPSQYPSEIWNQHPSELPSASAQPSKSPTFASKDDLQNAVNDYCDNPGEWETHPKFVTYG